MIVIPMIFIRMLIIKKADLVIILMIIRISGSKNDWTHDYIVWKKKIIVATTKNPIIIPVILKWITEKHVLKHNANYAINIDDINIVKQSRDNAVHTILPTKSSSTMRTESYGWLSLILYEKKGVSIHGGTPSSHPFLDGIFPYKPSTFFLSPFMEIPIWQGNSSI